ncbi:hypothetical protein B0J15DRAFT_122591 [Fusarium solani]|jgi:hypothetical protein|uniref:Uncharacterized protein n=1 Tax=Fusarium solani TaxID=169388 RepID=A0A9P9L4P3_FUSSL|nr:uncharacterized protein B0J15DRAFT_122591 [Fusarium solani]KAH7274183.1 hypothetical protein B0J15DRAFT_122591 [Fusarium solani]
MGHLFAACVDHLLAQACKEIEKTVIYYGQRTQRAFCLPECICVFSDEAPGMPEYDFWMAQRALTVSFIACGWTLLVTMPEQHLTYWDPWVIGLGFVNPVVVVAIVWHRLVQSKRRRLAQIPFLLRVS